ncbi:MAG: hypothetical protein WDN03_08150 [Rhizomicrobium sp.]
MLKPGGVMQIMLYSAAARLRVQAQRAGFADLLQGPIDDDLLREARRRAIAPQRQGHAEIEGLLHAGWRPRFVAAQA